MWVAGPSRRLLIIIGRRGYCGDTAGIGLGGRPTPTHADRRHIKIVDRIGSVVGSVLGSLVYNTVGRIVIWCINASRVRRRQYN